MQAQAEGVVFPGETIRHHRAERDARRHCLGHKVKGNLRFGTKRRVALAACELVGWGVGFHVERVVDPFIRPERADRDDAVVDLADAAEVLPPDVRRVRAVLAIPVSSITSAPLASAAVAGSAANVVRRQALTASASHVDSERNHCKRWAGAACAPTIGSVSASAVKVLLRSAGRRSAAR